MSMTDEQFFHLGAFAGFVRSVAANKDALDEFMKDTDLKYKPPRSPIESMMDKVFGVDEKIARQFIEWCATQYGREFLPENFMDELLRAKHE